MIFLKTKTAIKRSGLLLFLVGSVLLSSVKAAQFAIGETVFVAFPATNIKDDAFIIGKVTQVTEKGNYQISVLDYVEGHDYGSSCVPISKNADQDQGLGAGWELWQDTTKLDKQRLEYVVDKASVLKLDYGKLYFVERNNIFIVFGRWKSDAPVLTIDRMDRAIREAKSTGLEEMEAAFNLAKLHRASFYDDFKRPLMPFETIAPFNIAINAVFDAFKEDPQLETLWRTKPRNWTAIKQSTQHYFMVEAIDKVVRDATNQLYEEGLDQAGKAPLTELKTKLTKLKR